MLAGKHSKMKFLHTATPHDGLSSRINDGKRASIKDFPYQVALEFQGIQLCGGAIVAENWIVTSCTCALLTNSSRDLRIRAGTDKRGKGGSLRRVDRIVRHEKFGYTPTSLPVNDIALLYSNEPFKLGETRQPVELFRSGEKSATGDMATISGFGMIKNGTDLPKYLQFGEIPIMDLDVCKKRYETSFDDIPNGTICTDYHDGAGKTLPCWGDQGDPLVIQGRLAGIMSKFFSCKNNEFPPLYTEIAHFRPWIDQHLEQSLHQ